MFNLMHIHSNCPRCNSGILMPHSILRDEEGLVRRYYIHDEHVPQSGDMVVTICSLEQCGYTETLATPQTLANAHVHARKRLQTCKIT